MNLHWGRTLENERLMVRIRPRNKPNYSIPFAYNYTQDKHFWDSIMERASNRSTSNHSALYAKNDFLKKSRILTGIREHVTRNHSITMVIVMSSMFLFFTISITAAVVVFCKKRNTVFALQKCEEDDDDNEYEMDELTDVEYTSEYETETDGRHKGIRRPSNLTVKRESMDSSINFPLIVASTSTATASTQCENDPDYLHHLLPDRGKHYTTSADNRGAYQRMVVTAVLENQHMQDENSNERTNLVSKTPKQYSGLKCTHRDFSAYNMQASNIPDVSYPDDPPSYDSLSYKDLNENQENNHLYHNSSLRKKLFNEKQPYGKIPYVELTELPNKEQCSVCKSCNTYVGFDKKSDGSDAVLFVDLPPKSFPEDHIKTNFDHNNHMFDSYKVLSNKGTQSVGATPMNEDGPECNGAMVSVSTSMSSQCRASYSMSLPATPLDEFSYRCLSSAISSGSQVVPLAAPPNHDWRDSTVSISMTLDKVPAAQLASWDDLRDVVVDNNSTINTSQAYINSPESRSLIQSNSSIPASNSSIQTKPQRPCILSSTKPPNESNYIEGITTLKSPSITSSMSSLSSNIVTSICSSPLSSTPITPPAGFRNDCFLHSSSTDDSGIIS